VCNGRGIADQLPNSTPFGNFWKNWSDTPESFEIWTKPDLSYIQFEKLAETRTQTKALLTTLKSNDIQPNDHV
jgi:hypothetical protein